MRMILSLSSTGAALLVAVATSATAPWRDAPGAVSRGIGARFAHCVVDRHGKDVRAALDAPFGGQDSVDRFAKLSDTDCLEEAREGIALSPNQLTYPPLVARGLLAEALYHADQAHRRPEGDADAAATPIAYAPVVLDGPPDLGRNYRALMKIGDCFVHAQPEMARALLATAPGSKAEAKAIDALRPGWTACLPGGKPLPFSAEMIRGTIAEPLYRLTQGAAAPVRLGAR